MLNTDALKIIKLLFILSVFLFANSECINNYTNKDTTIKYKLFGLNFSPFLNDEDPNHNILISEEQITERMKIISDCTSWIRTFGSANGLEHAGKIAHNFGLKAAIEAWLSYDHAANEIEISNLIIMADSGYVDMAIVGSETLLRGDLTEQQLIYYIQEVREAIPDSIPVTTAETCNIIYDHPEIIDYIDIVLVNHYPYWRGIPLECSVNALDKCHRGIIKLAGDKQVIVSETGWPSCGESIGLAVPSPEYAAFYFLNFVSWARENDIDFFYFESFDEKWKTQYEGPQGACWGLWDGNGILKQGMENVFDGRTIDDNWSNIKIPDGPGEPLIEFIFVPDLGSFEDITGQVWHVNPAEYKVAVYIKVNNGWWTKPYWNDPSTPINCNGIWVCDITTGGIDEQATQIAAFLISNNYDPPSCHGQSALQEELYNSALAFVKVDRN